MLSTSFRCCVTVLLLALSRSTSCQITIDLQWAICDQDAGTVLRKLGLSDQEPYKGNNITYYDALPPQYTRKGLAFRTKVHKHQPISMIKARFDEEIEDVPPAVNCVWDRYGESTFYTCSLAFPLVDEKHAIWSEEQMAFASRYHSVDFDELVPYGPYLNPKWKTFIEDHKAVFDDVMAFAGDTPLHIMELEVPADLTEQESVHSKVTNYLQSRGVVICAEPQLPKTLRLFDALNFSDSDLRSGLATQDAAALKSDLKR